MNTTKIRKELHDYIDKGDERVLRLMRAVVTAYESDEEDYTLPATISLVICIGILSSCKPNYQTLNLESQWDTLRPLENPDKGWYHHMER